MASDPGTRAERKELTRRAILDAALTPAADSSLGAISLRQVAKEVGIVPTAFYRHFDSVESLGLALVDESFGSRRAMLLDVWRRAPQYRDFIDGSLPVLAEHVSGHRDHYAFTRSSSSPASWPPTSRAQAARRTTPAPTSDCSPT